MGSKTAQILELLKRPGGATLQELMAATEWQPPSIRGFISGTLCKKMGLAVNSTIERLQEIARENGKKGGRPKGNAKEQSEKGGKRDDGVSTDV